MPTSLWWNHLSDHPLVQWGITQGVLQETSLPRKGLLKKKSQKIPKKIPATAKLQKSQKIHKQIPATETIMIVMIVDHDSHFVHPLGKGA